jgi:hypothetical protein
MIQHTLGVIRLKRRVQPVYHQLNRTDRTLRTLSWTIDEGVRGRSLWHARQDDVLVEGRGGCTARGKFGTREYSMHRSRRLKEHYIVNYILPFTKKQNDRKCGVKHNVRVILLSFSVLLFCTDTTYVLKYQTGYPISTQNQLLR